MKKILRKYNVFLLLIIFTTSGCVFENNIEYSNNDIIYNGARYTLQEDNNSLRCEGESIKIGQKFSLFGMLEYYMSSLDVENNIIYDMRDTFYKEGFSLPNKNIESLERIYLAQVFDGSLDFVQQESEVIKFDDSEKIYLNDIIDEYSINENIKNKGQHFWLFIVYKNYSYFSIQYEVYFIDDKVYVSEFNDDEDLYIVNEDYNSFFIETINKIN